MVAHPFLMSGSQRSDLALVSAGAGELVATTGADGVQGLGLRSGGLGIAVKMSDGNMATVYAEAIDTLRQLGLTAGESDELQTWTRPCTPTVAGLRTGSCE